MPNKLQFSPHKTGNSSDSYSPFLLYKSKKDGIFVEKNHRMAEELTVDTSLTKEEQYAALIPQIRALVGHESDETANMANLSAALKQTFGFFWVGFYRVVGEELVLGSFQGPIACTRIRRGRGVCGTAWKEGRTLIVPDVDQFPGHIACNAASRSEIVLPYRREGKIAGVLDIDSEQPNHFDETDAKALAEILDILVDPSNI